MILYLTNHAPSLWNERGWTQGHCDVELSPAGIAMAKRLAQRPSLQEVQAVYASDLKRARQTAEPLCQRLGLEAILDPQLREWRMAHHHRDPAYPPLPFDRGDESPDELRRRARATLDRLARSSDRSPVLVVTHSAFLRAFLDSIDPQSATRFRAIQTALNRLRFEQGCWSIIGLNDEGPD
jgi:alpha-ribazole phosphatase